VTEPIRAEVAGRTLLGAPAPAYGGAAIFAALEDLEPRGLKPPLHSAANLDLVGRTFLSALARTRAKLGDLPGGRETSRVPAVFTELAVAEGTTHFVVVDSAGNIVCATQSLSLHFGAGVVAPGTGVLMNNSMSNFTYRAGTGGNIAAPGKRPWSTIAPIIVLQEGRPVLALGLPGSTRIPSGLLQVLADHLLLGRAIGGAIADTRVHWSGGNGERPARFESENTLPAEAASTLGALGWKTDTSRTPGGGSYFGGVNAIVLEPDGSRTGYADPRRTNAAAGH
jgi:gamma-glutamyltranspeptidase/glutathione hydrolase